MTKNKQTKIQTEKKLSKQTVSFGSPETAGQCCYFQSDWHWAVNLHSIVHDSGPVANTGSSVTAAVQNKKSAWMSGRVNDKINAWMNKKLKYLKSWSENLMQSKWQPVRSLPCIPTEAKGKIDNYDGHERKHVCILLAEVLEWESRTASWPRLARRTWHQTKYDVVFPSWISFIWMAG